MAGLIYSICLAAVRAAVLGLRVVLLVPMQQQGAALAAVEGVRMRGCQQDAAAQRRQTLEKEHASVGV
jgi:hypothetical protein